MRVLASLSLIVPLAGNAFSSAIPQDLALASPKNGTNSLGVLVRPAQALSNIHIEYAKAETSSRFDPGEVYYTIFTALVSYWKAPDNVPITEPQGVEGLSHLSTVVEPSQRSNLLTTAVAAAGCQKLLGYIATLDWSLGRRVTINFSADTTPRPPLFGQISTFYNPSARLESPSVNDTDTAVPTNSGIKISIHYDGQKRGEPPIAPQLAFRYFTGVTAHMFGAFTPDDYLEFPPNRGTFRFALPLSRLAAQVTVLPVPATATPLTMDELMRGVSLVIRDCVVRRGYEQFRAEIVREGRRAAEFTLSYVAAAAGEGGVATA